MLLGASGSSEVSTGFFSKTINQSLRFDEASSSCLERTPSSSGNRRTWSFSCWIKRANLTASGKGQSIFSAGTNVYNRRVDLDIGADHELTFFMDGRADGASYYALISSSHLRDVSSWYHIMAVMDTTDSTSDDRLKLYINGTRDTGAYQYGHGAPPEDSDWYVNHTNAHDIGNGHHDSVSQFFDGYMAEVHHVDGTALDPSSFGETKDGIWVPKAYSGSYGTNGFYLPFDDGSAIGDDESGQGDDFTVTGGGSPTLASGDVVKDSPTNNFATMNALVPLGSAQSLFTGTEGGLKVTTSASSYAQGMATTAVKTGKWYYEVYITAAGYPSWQIGWLASNMDGLGNSELPTWAGANNAEMTGTSAIGYFTGSDLYIADWGAANFSTQQVAASGFHSAGDAPTTGDIIGIAADFDNRKFFFHINGEYGNVGAGTGNPATGANPSSTYTESEIPDNIDKFPWLVAYGTSGFVFNFGQDGSFAGNLTGGNVGTESDGESIGAFKYAVPSGFKAICTSNLSDITIGPGQSTQADDHFNTVLYTGNGGTNAITGVGFQPDLVWVKARSASNNNELYDSVRGTAKRLYSDSDVVESTGSLTAFGTDGFTHVSGPVGGNANTVTYAAWNWKAGTSFSNDASATSVGNVDSAGSVNQAAGFSIIGYTGVNQSEMDIAHGLGATPEIIFLKDRDSNSNTNAWHGWHKDISANYFYLSSNAASAAEGDGYGTFKSAHTDTLIKFRTNGTANSMTESGDDYIVYAFRSIDGYSHVGSYVGNGSADGPYVYTGFRPAFVLLKIATGTTGNWSIYDNKRDTDNVVREYLIPNDSQVAGTTDTMDFLSNGFKVRNASNYINYSGGLYIFLAFAEQPFKFANAR